MDELESQAATDEATGAPGADVSPIHSRNHSKRASTAGLPSMDAVSTKRGRRSRSTGLIPADESLGTTSSADSDAASSEVSDTLNAVLDELRAIRRDRQHVEFSFWNLAGAIAQAIAVCIIAWGIVAAVDHEWNGATIRLLAGIAFQMMAMTWLSLSRRA